MGTRTRDKNPQVVDELRLSLRRDLPDPALVAGKYLDDGLSISELARKFGVSRSTVSKALAEARIGTRPARREGYLLAQVPYGWTRRDGRLVPSTKERAIIGLISEMRRSGRSLRYIAQYLTETGVPTKSGGEWDATTIRRILMRHTKKP